MGTHVRIFPGGRGGNTQNEKNLSAGRGGSLGGGPAPATHGSITTVFLPAPYCSHFARSGTSSRERRLKRSISGVYLTFSLIVQHRALSACEGTRAHTRAHTRQPGSHPPRPPPLRTSSCQNAAQDPPIPSSSRPKASFATNQHLANQKLTSHRRGCNNGHTVLRFCPCRPIFQTVIRPLAGGLQRQLAPLY